MIKFNNFLNFPTYYKNRQQRIIQVSVSIIDYQKTDNELFVQAIANNKYNVSVSITNLKSKETKVNCTCDSFKYEFAKSLDKVDGLLNREYYVNIWKKGYIRKTRRRSNPFNIPSGCKHVIATCRMIRRKFNI